jgi:phosphatidyl-myo-inositol alpha-mannosyltransferase
LSEILDMKIGLVSPYDFSFSGGVNNHITHLAGHFMQSGHDVKILAPRSDKTNRDYPFEIIAIGRPFPISAISTVSRVPVSPWLPFQVAYTLQREKFDILHIHEPLIPLLPLSVLLTSNTTTIGTFHAFHEKPRYYRFGRLFLKNCLPRLHGKIVVSEPARSFIASYLPDNYSVIPNGVDVRRFSGNHTRRRELDDGKLNFLFIGRLEKRKGLDYLLRAYSKVQNQIPPSRLVVVGAHAKNDPKYEEMSCKLGIRDIVFTGAVADNELPSYYQSADVFFAPATHGESFGIVLLEAMASGVPIIASGIPGYASVLSHEKEGLLVAPRDENALMQAMLSLSGNAELRKAMSASGRTKAEKYSWENIANRVMECYRNSLAARNRAL